MQPVGKRERPVDYSTDDSTHQRTSKRLDPMSSAEERFMTQRHSHDSSPVSGLSSLSRQASHYGPPRGAPAMAREVIDLTDSPPRLRQAETETYGKTTFQAPEDDYLKRYLREGDEDLRLALELQAQFDAEFDFAGPSSAAPNPPETGGELDGSFFGSDEEYALYYQEALRFENPVRGDFTTNGGFSVSSTVQDDARMAHELESQLNREIDSVPPTYEEVFRETVAPEEVVQRPSKQNSDAVAAEERQTLHYYGQSMLQLRCSGCRKHVIYDEDGVRKLPNRWLTDDNHVNSSVRCSYCKESTCLGCGRSPHLSPATEVVGKFSLSWCCEKGRMFLIWVLLSSLPDTKVSGSSRRSRSLRSLKARLHTSSKKSVSSGVGYGDTPRTKGRRGEEPLTAIRNAEPTDAFLEQVLKALEKLMPRIHGSSIFDVAPPPTLLAMLKRSPVLEKTAQLLRNDSIDILSSRINLYQAVVAFTQTLSQHPVTSTVVHQERTIYSDRSGLLATCFGDYQPTKKGGNSEEEKTYSLVKSMENLRIQAEAFLKQASQNQKAFESSSEHQVLELCERILKLSKALEARKNRECSRETVPAPLPLEDMNEWHKEKCVMDVEDDILLHHHFFARQAKQITQPAKGRMKKLMMEIANMRTSLPSGIYIRHGASRLDIMKALIIGPKESPYENGMFEFDILCPLNYPHEPPQVHFKTTGSGRAHFNPNLYTDGKVCLSLLGTWSGEPWRPGQSTLLQVLVSMQSMILCDEPWCNEPGRESQVGSKESKNYNKSIRLLTLQYALLEWARQAQSEQPNQIWAKIVDKHFGVNVEDILRTARQWKLAGLGTTPHPTFGLQTIPPPPTAVMEHFALKMPGNSVPSAATSAKVAPPNNAKAGVNSGLPSFLSWSELSAIGNMGVPQPKQQPQPPPGFGGQPSAWPTFVPPPPAYSTTTTDSPDVVKNLELALEPYRSMKKPTVNHPTGTASSTSRSSSSSSSSWKDTVDQYTMPGSFA